MTPTLKHLRSIRGRITLISTMLVAITLVVASVVLMRWVQADLLASAQDTLDLALEEQAEQLGISEFLDEDLEEVEDFLPEEQFFESYVDGNQVSLGLFTAQGDGFAIGELAINGFPVAGLMIDVETGEVVEVFDSQFEQRLEDPDLIEEIGSLAFEVIEVGPIEDGQFFVGAASLDEVEESVEAIRQALMFIVPALVLAFAALTWWLVGRALRPVMSITSQVEAISTSSLDRRVPVPDTNDEVANLASVMNRMLDRLQRGGERQRQFSADASHELRSPLSTVRAAGEMLGRNPSPDRARRLAEDIVAESDRMDELISDLLELSRLDEDRRGLTMEETNLVELLLTELAIELAEGTVVLESPPALSIMASPRQLRRLVRNLVDNAARHADQKVVVSVTSLGPPAGTAAADAKFGAGDEGRRVLLTVDDDGAGVADEAKRAIFERFSRLDEARSRDAGGAGLGLALVRAIAESHRGTAAAEDSPLGGARFAVTLPVGSVPLT